MKTNIVAWFNVLNISRYLQFGTVVYFKLLKLVVYPILKHIVVIHQTGPRTLSEQCIMIYTRHFIFHCLPDHNSCGDFDTWNRFESLYKS